MNRTLAPIVLFVYNRPFHSEKTLNALMQNWLADESELYIFCDGPKPNASTELLKEIADIRELVYSKKWCKEVHIIESKTNKGLADSIIEGVTEVVNKHGRVIVLEDDLVISPGFLEYMNNALDFYQDEEKVMHISGYMFPHKEKLPETFFFTVPMCWGWATWKRSWKYFNTDSNYLYHYFEDNNLWERFNQLGGKYLQKQLEANYNGTLKTWFIRWHASVLIQKGLALYPGNSLVQNVGFDETGTNCTPMTKFDVGILPNQIQVTKIPIKVSKQAKHIIINFYQGSFYYLRHFIIKIIPSGIKPFLKKTLKIS